MEQEFVSRFASTLTGLTFSMPEEFRRSAWSTHVPFAFWLIEHLKPKKVVELGTFYGMSFLAFCQAAKAANVDAQVYGIDSWQGDRHAGRLYNDVFSDLTRIVKFKYPEHGVLVKSSFAEAVSRFHDRSIDLLHIDGFHTYEAVRNDYDTWESKLAPNAAVLFHDTNERKEDFGVFRFWDEVRVKGRSFHFLHGHGLGVLGLGKSYPKAIERLFGADNMETEFIRTVFERLGRGVSDAQRVNELDNSNIVHLVVKAHRRLSGLMGVAPSV